MTAYGEAVAIAKQEGKWSPHPNRKRKDQAIAFVEGLGGFWESDNPAEDVDINGCVVYDKKTDEYFLFVSTDLKKQHDR